MKQVPFILIGESHGSLPAHEFQSRIIRALFALDVRLAVGLEMVSAERQDILSGWESGAVTDEDFLRGTRWYSSWGFHFDFYRPILDFAREHRIPLHALDSPKEIVGRFQVCDGVVIPGETKPASGVDPADAGDRLLLRKNLESSGMPEAIKTAVLSSMFEEIFSAQAARDADMGTRAVAIHKRDGRKVVVLVGAGHLMYGFGLSRQVREKSGLPVMAVVPVLIPKGVPAVKVSRTLADYIVGLATEDRPAYPEIGLTFKAPPDPSKLVIAARPEKGAAKGLDFEENDLILSVDERTFPDVESLQIYLAGIPWGGQVLFRILRQGFERIVVMRIPKTP